MRSNPETKVFITHVRTDKDLIQLSRLLAQYLGELGFEVWTEERILPEEDEEDAVENALRECDAMIALLSQHAYSSSYVRNELEHAFFDERYKNRLLPVLISTPEKGDFSRLPWVLTKMDYLKIIEPLSTQAMAKLITDHFIDLLEAGSGS